MFGLKNEENNKVATVNYIKKFNKTNQKGRKQFKCYKCGNIGHKANVCRAGGKSQEKKDFHKKEKSNDKRKCYKCGNIGHIANDCKVRTAKANTMTEQQATVNVLTCSEEKLLTLNETINGHEVECAFDSGATSSVISLRVVEEYGLKIKNSKTNVQSVFGEIKQVKGITEDVELSIAGRVVQMPLLVLEGQNHDVLLGLNWFKLTRAGIFPATGVLPFQKENIMLNGCSEEDSSSTLMNISCRQ